MHAKKIKIGFSDFFVGFDPENNFWTKFLRRHFDIEISNEPDVLLHSCYGIKHLNYNCPKVLILGENLRPDFRLSDYAISFDYLDSERHLRLPLYVQYFDEDYTVEKLLQKKTDKELDQIIASKKHFCCFLVSNGVSKKRIEFFHKLSKYKHVHSGGRVLNNIGGPVKNKLEFVKDFKFIIAFENNSTVGYTTEKVLEPKQVDTVPIYWGNPEIGREMNTKSFINYNDCQNFDELIEKVIEADTNEAVYRSYLAEPIFKNHQPNEYFDEERMMNFFSSIFESSSNIIPVASTPEYKKLKRQLQLEGMKKNLMTKVFRKKYLEPWYHE